MRPKRPYRVTAIDASGARFVRTYATEAKAEGAMRFWRESGATDVFLDSPKEDPALDHDIKGWGRRMLLRYARRLRKRVKGLRSELDAAIAANRVLRERGFKVGEGNDIVELYRAPNGEYRWRRRDPDNWAVLSGPQEGYTQKGYNEKAAHRANPDVPDERFVDQTEDPAPPPEPPPPPDQEPDILEDGGPR